MPDSFNFLEGLLGDGRPFLAGEKVTVGDCTLAAGFQFSRFANFDVLADYPALRAWDARYRARESAASVLVL
jgi:glutathione S-transferase